MRINGKNWVAYLALLATIPMVASCGAFDFLLNQLQPNRTFVTFVNNGDFAVDGFIIIDDEQDTIEELLEEVGTEISFFVDVGETSTISRDCDQLQALLLDDANLQVVGGAGPDSGSDVLRDGSDFGCGDRITFTFDHSEIISDFHVTITVE